MSSLERASIILLLRSAAVAWPRKDDVKYLRTICCCAGLQNRTCMSNCFRFCLVVVSSTNKLYHEFFMSRIIVPWKYGASPCEMPYEAFVADNVNPLETGSLNAARKTTDKSSHDANEWSCLMSRSKNSKLSLLLLSDLLDLELSPHCWSACTWHLRWIQISAEKLIPFPNSHASLPLSVAQPGIVLHLIQKMFVCRDCSKPQYCWLMT